MDVAALLHETPLFAGLDAGRRTALAALAEPLSLHSGQRLYGEGDPSDALYLLVSGRLRVSTSGEIEGYVARLELVGEAGMLAGEPRASAVHAIRDSLLLRFASGPLLELLAAQAAPLLALTRLALTRLRQARHQQRRAAVTEGGGCFTLVPAGSGVPVLPLAEALVRRWGDWPEARLVTARHVDAALGEGTAQTACIDVDASRRLLSWLRDLEGRHRYLVYVADNARDAWTLRCLRQADRILVVAEAQAEPVAVPAMRQLPEAPLAPRRPTRDTGAKSPARAPIIFCTPGPLPNSMRWRARSADVAWDWCWAAVAREGSRISA